MLRPPSTGQELTQATQNVPTTPQGVTSTNVTPLSPFETNQIIGDVSGQISTQSESGVAGGDAGAANPDNNGNWAYGAYQFNTAPGNGMDEFLNHLRDGGPETQPMYSKLMGAGGRAAADKGDPKFVKAWKELARNPNFLKHQHLVAKKSYLSPLLSSLKKAGYDFSKAPVAIQESLLATAINHGAGGAHKIVLQALQDIGFKAGSSMSQLPAERFVDHLYQKRTAAYRPNTKSYERERVRVQQMLMAEQHPLESPRMPSGAFGAPTPTATMVTRRTALSGALAASGAVSAQQAATTTIVAPSSQNNSVVNANQTIVQPPAVRNADSTIDAIQARQLRVG